jgi:hypothetical protein
LYKSHTITKQQYEQALAAKQEAESQVRILQQAAKATAFQKSVIVANQKPQINKLTLRLPISKEPKPCLIRQIKSNHGCNCCH